jgi:hypothetical protein
VIRTHSSKLTSAGKELGIDLSDFNYAKLQFEVFVDDLERASREGLGLLQFEDTLLYLHLPQLPQHPRQPHLQPTDLLERFLTWLRGMGVSAIMELRLPDCWSHYDLDFIVDRVLGRFRVYELDWLRLDADIGELASRCRNAQGSPPILPLRKLYIYQEQRAAQNLPAWLAHMPDAWIREVCRNPPIRVQDCSCWHRLVISESI